ncbi:MAG: RimK family alpha-L-glutamate ligase [Saprospiraceae bacterium]
MKKYDVILLTEHRYENPPEPDWYDQQILTEDGYVIAALERHGLKVMRLDWATPHFDWASTRLAVFRTTWDYFDKIGQFLPWLDHVATQTALLNPYPIVRWNIDKHYLLDLQNRGIHIIPTHIVERGQACNLAQQMTRFDTPELIIKPCVAGTARHAYRVNRENLEELQAIFNALVAEEAMLVQPFQRSVMERGEVSVVVIGGVARHAVLKVAKPGDFRVHDDFGGSVHAYEPTLAERELAERACASCSPLPAYARVDLILDNEGQPAISEFEVVEPELFFRFNPEAAGLLAEEILKEL